MEQENRTHEGCSQVHNNNLAWHYTVYSYLDAIAETGALLPAKAFITKGEKPILWFSKNQEWEQTANKMMQNEAGKVYALNKEETDHYGGGLIRFGVDQKKLIPWPLLAKKARIPKEIQKGLEMTAAEKGGNPKEWMGILGKLKISKCEAIEILHEGKWIPLFEKIHTTNQ